MFFNANDEKSFVYFVKLPGIDHKFALGCKNLRSAQIGTVIDLAKDVGTKLNIEYTEDPVLYCWELGKIIADDSSFAFCISKGFGFEIFDGLAGVMEVECTDHKSNFLSNLARNKNENR